MPYPPVPDHIPDPIPESLAWAHPVTQEWFTRRFGTPTEPQQQGWPHILAARPTLISAPTGSGKTLAAFLICIDRLLREALENRLPAGTSVVYISPLKALSNDVQKNLEAPLREIQELALARGYLCPPIRAAVRTGDTPPSERRAMLKSPPHILVTTPESLYILLTSLKSREHLRRVHTVIVDEIHAVADDKRGSHLALTLERLDALVTAENSLTPGASLLTHPAPQRIGLSATQNPIELVASFLGGERNPNVQIVQCGQHRTLDLAVEIPSVELGAVASNAIWDSVYDRIAELANQHRSTLVFVNTRRMAERLAFQLAERLGTENVAAHHGSLSRKLRLEAERRLKAGEIRVLVATASLELGIDIGAVELVCQVNSTRAIAVAMQRVGRAGHWRGATPKGRFFPTTRDDLVETAALMRAMRTGILDRLKIPPRPFDVLMQQIVAACAAEPWDERALYAVLRRAHPYRDLPYDQYDRALTLLTDGIESSRGRYGSYLLRDRVHGHIQARRGARITAVTNGGTIPDTALFPVIAQPEGVQIATLDEHFAVESSPGDIIQLGNTSWRIQRIESAGRVLVEDAQGLPPTVPFWSGEAPQRTAELSAFVSDLRLEIDRRTPTVLPGYISEATPEVAAAIAWLKSECCVCDSGAKQLIAYVAAGRAILGAVPSVTTIVAERFFDEGGGMQLILHAPFGGRINKAWGLALRKRFCRGFNFELQAAATDNGINISLAEQHSFPLSDVFQFLTIHTVRELLEQASLASPIFKTRWKWAANRSLQLLRFQKGKKVAPQIQRTRADDLLASVFPQAAACFENIQGDIQIPDHPLVAEVMQDVLGEAMDLAGLIHILEGIDSGRIRCLAVDTATPSAFAHELLNANPYAFLDDADLEERRARAVHLRGVVPPALLGEAGRFSPQAIAEVRETLWPDIRDEHELHDLLQSLLLVPSSISQDDRTAPWAHFFTRLETTQRALLAKCNQNSYFCAAERAAAFHILFPEAQFSQPIPQIPHATTPSSPDEVLRKALQGWLQILGPVTAHNLAAHLGLSPQQVFAQLLYLETTGTILRGAFEQPAATSDHHIEWCERRILQRIHKRTIGQLRKQIQPIPPAAYMRFLLDWQHLGPQRQLTGESGLLDALRALQGYEAPAIEWERAILPARVANYDPRWLDALCLTGVIGWGRISPHPAFQSPESGGPRRVVPTSMAPITFFLREEAHWMDRCLAARQIPEAHLTACLSPLANRLRSILTDRGALFAADLARLLAAPPAEISRAIWELVAAGLVTADGFDALRALIDPRRKSAFAAPNGRATQISSRATQIPGRNARAPRNAAGRWSLLADQTESARSQPTNPENSALTYDLQLESACLMLLHRYGVVFRDLAANETSLPRWRELHGLFRRLEDRGLVRGGRFVSGFSGEQFALPHAVESLRACRQRPLAAMPPLTVAAADPVNLIGIVLPGERTTAIPGRTVTFPPPTLAPEAPPPAATLLPLQPAAQEGEIHA